MRGASSAFGRVTREDWSNAAPRADEIGISPSLSPKFPLLSVPYGCLVPRGIDGLLVAGRHISCDPSSHSFLREIPQCWLTGHAAARGVRRPRPDDPQQVPPTSPACRRAGARISKTGKPKFKYGMRDKRPTR